MSVQFVAYLTSVGLLPSSNGVTKVSFDRYCATKEYLFDLSAAFDTVDYDILIERLSQT